MKKVIILFVLIVAALVPAMIYAQGLVEYPAIFTLCSDQPLIAGPLPDEQVPGGGDVVASHWVSGTHTHIIVDVNCYISKDAIVKGMVIEPDHTDFSIYVDPSSKVLGNIEEKGPGDVRMTVGHDGMYRGGIKEEGPGDVHLWVDGTFIGKVKERDEGYLTINIFDENRAGPGTYIGNAAEYGNGHAHLGVYSPPLEGESGKFSGKFSGEEPGGCSAVVNVGAQTRGIVCSPDYIPLTEYPPLP